VPHGNGDEGNSQGNNDEEQHSKQDKEENYIPD